MNKIFWFDTETGGTDALKNGLIELSYLIEIDKEIVDKGSLKMNPLLIPNKTIEDQALEVNGLDRNEISLYPKPLDFYSSLTNMLSKYVNRYDKLDKFIPAGYNVHFDEFFLKQFFLDMGDNYYGSWFSYKFLDVFPLVFHYVYQGKFPELNSYTLSNVAYVLGIESDNFHNAMEDILITRQVYLKLLEIDKLFTN